jgi:signal transduction histidine kinase
VFLFLFVFQGLVFRTYYTQEKINDVKNETALLLSKEDLEDLQLEELLFSRNTNTITSIIPLSDMKSNFDNLDITVLEVSTNEGVISLYAPSLSETSYEIGQPVSSTSFSKNNDTYIPTYLSVNNKTLLRRNTSSNQQSDFLDLLEINEEDYLQIEGEIVSITNNESPGVNSLVSNEILNVSSENYISMVSYDLGNYYFSNETNNENASLVFYSIISIDEEDHVVISVYPMDYIDEIVVAAGRANVYMFIVVLLILIMSAFVYSREFSRPLLFINNKTKELSMLDFTSPIISIDSTDEFAELAQNINTLSANLQATLYQLSEQNKQLSETIAQENIVESNRRDFIQGMSHELKTPLAVIQASAEAIENNIYETEKDKGEALVLIQEEVKKTKIMLNSMIAVYKLDSPDYQKQWLEENITELIHEIDRSLSPLYINSNISVELDLDEAKLKCDRDKIETIITNLFTNAIKYTPHSEQIKISLRDSKDKIRFEIANYGVSIDKVNQSKIFDAFYRADKSRSRKDGSTGLGLYIVNQTLEQYSSKCEVFSNNDSVTFAFEIKKSF